MRGGGLSTGAGDEDLRGAEELRTRGGGVEGTAAPIKGALRQVNEGLGRTLAPPPPPTSPEPEGCTQADGAAAEAHSVPCEFRHEVAGGKNFHHSSPTPSLISLRW